MPDVADHDGVWCFSVDDAVGDRDRVAVLSEGALHGRAELGVISECFDTLPEARKKVVWDGVEIRLRLGEDDYLQRREARFRRYSSSVMPFPAANSR